MVGSGPEQDRWKRLARELAVADRIRWIPSIDDEGLIALYAGARLVVVTSADEDLGYVPLEAFLSEKAVLTTEDAGGPLEFVKDGETGFVVPPTPESLGAAMRIAWQQEAVLSELGRRGRERISGITWEKTVSALLSAAGISVA